MTDYQEVYGRAVRGAVTEEEVDRVAEELANTDSERPTMLLAILGEAKATRHRDLVERYIRPGTDPVAASAALRVLLVDWRMAGEYLDEILEFVGGVPWDSDLRELREIAIWEAGEHLRRHREPGLLRALVDIADDPDEDPDDRTLAHAALASALGKALTNVELPAEERATVSKEAKQRLAEWGG